MQFMVICLLSEPGQGAIAEMLLTRITGAYYNAGGGFCIDVAGKSIEGLYFNRLTYIQTVDIWNDHSKWVEQNTPLLVSTGLQLARHLHRIQRIAQEVRISNEAKITRDPTQTNEWCAIVRQYRDYDSWQTPEILEMVQKFDEVWARVKEMYP